MIEPAGCKEAFENAKREYPDIIIVDTGASKIEGYELIKRLKSVPYTLNIPIIAVVTAFNPTFDEYKNYIDVVIKKPFPKCHLISEIANLLPDFNFKDNLNDSSNIYAARFDFDAEMLKVPQFLFDDLCEALMNDMTIIEINPLLIEMGLYSKPLAEHVGLLWKAAEIDELKYLFRIES
jgi:DNA-binding response OmpR family regulator